MEYLCYFPCQSPCRKRNSENMHLITFSWWNELSTPTSKAVASMSNVDQSPTIRRLGTTAIDLEVLELIRPVDLAHLGQCALATVAGHYRDSTYSV